MSEKECPTCGRHPDELSIAYQLGAERAKDRPKMIEAAINAWAMAYTRPSHFAGPLAEAERRLLALVATKEPNP